MSSEEELAKFAAILDEFSAAQRRQALDGSKRQRIQYARQIGQAQASVELVIDEGAQADEIWAMLAPVDAALDRMRAKADLIELLDRALADCRAIDVAQAEMRRLRGQYEEENVRASQNRRQAVALSSAQRSSLDNQRTSIAATFERIDEKREQMLFQRDILDGSDPAGLLQRKLAAKLDELRFLRPPEAA